MKNYIIFFCILFSIECFAQQDAQFTQYMYNTVNINPAYAGTREGLSFFGLHRSQWVGLDGAPSNNTISVNTPINYTRFGAGLSIINDKLGPINNNSFSVDLSYSIDLNEEYQLSFGLKGNLNVFNLDANKLRASDGFDPNIQSISSKITPNFGSGLYLFSDKTYVGVSVRNMLKHVMSNQINTYQEKMNFYLIAGQVFDLNMDMQFKPAILMKAVGGAPLQVDLSGNFLLQEKITFGLAYRWSAAVSALAGYQISKGLFLGYGYDFDTTKLGSFNSGSHEVFLRYEILRDNNRITTPRFF